jgi:adenylate cyclase
MIAGYSGIAVKSFPKSDQTRRLAAVLVADAVGYSGLMEVAETETHKQYKIDLTMLFMPTVREYRGRIVRTTGDGLLAEFASIVDCVQCAIDLQEDWSRRPTRHLSYRIGINVGDIIVDTDDIYGDGVIIATHLQGLAEPGGIVLSADAYRQVMGKLDASFEDMGERPTKNVTETIRAFRVVRKDSGTGPGATRMTTTLATIIPSIVVLPFETLGRDPDYDYFSDGITNEITTSLSKFSELFVIASQTAFAYRAKPIKIPQIGRELGVRYVVGGSVQRTDQRIRINVQLIEAASGRHLWAERYDRSAQEIFHVQEEIAQTIVGTLITRLDMSEHRRVMHKQPNDLETYDVYLRGRAAWREWNRESNRRAQEYFRRTIDLDPGFAPAYAFLSYAVIQARLSGWDSSPEKLQYARDLAVKAITIEPDNFENHWSLAMAYLYGREFDLALATFERAASMNSNSAGLLIDMADALVFDGRAKEAIACVERAIKLNPIFPDSYSWTLGIALYHSGEFEKALSALNRIVTPPSLVRRHHAATLVRLGQIEAARRMAAEFLVQEPGYTLEREKLWPYRDASVLEAFMDDLRAAGLPEK